MTYGLSPLPPPPSNQVQLRQPDDEQQQLLALQTRIREGNIQQVLPKTTIDHINGKLLNDSVAYRALREGVTHTPRSRYVLFYFLFTMSLFSIFMTFFATAVWIPSFVLFVLYGIIYPIIKLCQFYEDGTLLSIYLSLIYCFCIVLLIGLLPSVLRYQSRILDIVDVSRLPNNFYQVCVVKEIHRRFVTHIDRKIVFHHLEQRCGIDIARYIFEFLENKKYH